MSDINTGKGGCCPQRAEDVTHLKIGEHGIVVGMMGLGVVFQQLYALGHHPDEVIDEELVGMARQFNYIRHDPVVETDYAAALRQAYTAFYQRQEQLKDNQHVS